MVYDGDGNRVRETVGSTTTNYLIDDLNPTGYSQVLDERVSGSVTRTYAYGLKRISENQLVGSTWTPSFYGYDGHGNVRFLANTAGAITDSYTFDAFGIPIASTGTTANNFRYSGEWLDPGLSFYNLRARYYNALTGRFETMDPYAGSNSDPATLHKYVYAKNNPVNATDPSGRDIAEYISVLRFELLPAVVYAARLVCFTYTATLLTAETLSYISTGKFFGIPYPLVSGPCAAISLGFPPSPPS